MTGGRGSTLALDAAHVWHPFTQAHTADSPIAVARAAGTELVAEDGTVYLDLISSWWVNLHGHGHPKIAAAIAAQAASLEQVIFAGFTHRPAATLAGRLCELLPGDLTRVFYSDDGSTAVEVALKLARQYWVNRGGPQRTRFLAFDGGYHGDTFGAMAAGARSGFFAPFEDLMFDVTFLPYPATWTGDAAVDDTEARALAALDAALDQNGATIAALIVEPLVQGAGGMRMCRPKFLRAVDERLHAAGVLGIYDEIMVGFGRTGTLFACEQAGVTPDLICLSKGLTGGFLPLAATVAREPIYAEFLGDDFAHAFAHGHSFTANPLGCAAALAALDLTVGDETAAARRRIEAKHRARLEGLGKVPGLVRPRLAGTIAAVEFDTGDAGYSAAIGQTLKPFFLERGLLLRPLGNVVYLLPPYCVTDAELDRAYDAIEEAAARFAE